MGSFRGEQHVQEITPSALGGALTLTLVASGAGIASAESQRDLEIGTLAAESVPVGVADPGAAVQPTIVADGSLISGSGANVHIPSNSESDIVVSVPGEQDVTGLTISLPSNATGASSLQSGSSSSVFEGGSASTVIHGFEDGLRLSTVIEDASGPSSYDYGLPQEVAPVIQPDGSVLLRSEFTGGDLESGESVVIEYGHVDPAWAVDANGAPVKTEYEVRDGLLRQNVQVDASTAFPVVADPTFWWGWNAFIPNSVHQKVFKALAVGAAATTIANIFVSYIPNPYVQLAVRLAAALAIAGTALWNACNFNGRGVIVGQSWLAGAIPPGLGTTFIRLGFFCLPQ